MAEPQRRFVVAYILFPLEEGHFIEPAFVNAARHCGVDLIPFDHAQPLPDQGAFDVVIHKQNADEWRIFLLDFADPEDPAHLFHPMLHSVYPLRDLTHGFGKEFDNMLIYCPDDNTMLTIHMNTQSPIDAMSLPPGGAVFKVRVSGMFVRCVKRSFLDPEGAQQPARPARHFLEKTARHLQRYTGAELFHYYIVRDAQPPHVHQHRTVYYMRDIKSRVAGFYDDIVL